MEPKGFLRIDERLVHGQVLVAWAGRLRPERVVLANDAVAADPARRRMAEALGQDDFPVVVATLEEAAAMLAAGTPIFVVVASPADALDLVERGAGVTRVNVGGLRGAGKRELTSYVFLSREEAGDLRSLLAHGIELEARDLPGASGLRIDAAALEQLWP